MNHPDLDKMFYPIRRPLKAIIAPMLTALFLLSVGNAMAAQYLNSAEPMCNGSDPTVLMCDDFEDGTWYVTDADNGGKNSPPNDGWDGHIYADDDGGNGHARCGNLGAVGTNCVATSGYRNGARYEAIHYFGPSNTAYNEIYHRFYTKFSPGYKFDHEKLVFYQKNGSNSGQVAVLMTPFGSDTLDFTIMRPDTRAGQNQGKNIRLIPGHWYYIEVHIRVADSGGNGQVRMWADDCGTDGLGCTGPGTLRLTYDGVKSTNPIGVIWQENWSNKAVGEVYNDQVIVRTKRIGPMGGSPTPPPLAAPSNLRVR